MNSAYNLNKLECGVFPSQASRGEHGPQATMITALVDVELRT